MVAIFTGAGTGFERGSGSVLGGSGLLGSAGLGRSGEQVFLNAANGNLLINRQDEFLVGRGPDAGVGRTYNSLGNRSDDNGDNWLQSTDRRVYGLTGTANSWGSTVKRRSGDGSEITYRWDGTSYVATDGTGSFDRLSYNGTNWIWTDGDSRVTESYAAYGSYWRIISQSDTSGNALTYGYTGDRLTTLTTANGETLSYGWSGNHISEVISGDGTATRYFYDSYDRLSRVDTELTGGGSVYSTWYSYVGATTLVSRIEQTDGAALDILYDGSNRVTSLAQTVAAGATRTTSIAYGAGYTIVTDPAGQATRLDYAPENLVTDLSAWSRVNLTASPAMIDGRAATRFEITNTGWSAAYREGVAVAAGDTVTWGITLQGMGSVTTQWLGIHSPISNWGANGLSSARIVSGPGQLVQDTGGSWYVVGLSATTGTRIEIVRVAAQADQFSLNLYPDRSGGSRAGEGVIAGDAVVYKSSTATDPYLSDQGNWDYAHTVRRSAVALDGGAAYQYTILPGATWPVVFRALAAELGDTFTYTVTLQGVGDSSATTIGLHGNSSNWGYDSWASARIVSGPGSISRDMGALFSVSGLSTTTPTRIEITRTYDRAETGGIYAYVDGQLGAREGRALIMGAPKLTRDITAERANQLTKITTGYGTAQAQTVEFGYNANGDLTSVTDGLGNTASYTYDANGNQLTATDRLGNVVTRTYGAANQLLTETRTGSDKDSAAAAHTTRYVYDGANRLVYTVSAEGQVTRNWYDGHGQLYWISEFPDHRYDLSGLAASQALSQSQLDGWCAGLGDTSSSQVTYMLFDARGNLTQRLRGSTNNNFGSFNGVGGQTDERFAYDSAGRLLSRYVLGQNVESFAYDGLGRVTAKTDLNGGTTSIVFNDAATQTVITLANGFVRTSTYNKAGELISSTESGEAVAGGTASYAYDKNGRLRVVTDATGLRTYHLYDKLGRKIADIDAAGNTSEYRYDANDRLVATIRYATSMRAGIVALLANPDADIDLASVRPAADEYDIRTWSVYDKEGRVIEVIEGDGSVTAYEYDGSGRLVKTTGYANKLSSGQLDAFKVNGPSAWLPVAHAKDSVARIFYDKDGRKIGALDGEGYLTRTIYDGSGRKVREIAYANITNAALRASGSFQSLIDSAGTSASDRSVHHVYDGQDLLRFTIDALGQVTEYGYGTGAAAIGLVRQTTRYAGTLGALSSYSHASVKAAVAALASDPANRTSWAVYDNASRLAYAIDAAGAVIGYSYDTRGQMVRKAEYATARATGSLPSLGDMDGWASGTTTANDRITRYYYSARGELRYTVDAEGYVTGHGYDAEGRKVWEGRWGTPIAATDSWSIYMVAASVGGEVSARSYAYDPAGRLSLTTDGEGSTRRYYYHANGLLAWDILSEGGQDDSRTYYVYDAAGRKASVYAAYGTAEQAITTYAYNGLGDLVEVSDPNAHATDFEYDHAGRVIRQTNAYGSPTVFEYNAFGEVTRTINARGFSTYSYYDQAGRVTSVVDALNYATTTSYTVFGEVASVTRAGATTSFAYDKLGRVVTTTDAEGGVETGSYDAFGNRIRFVNKLGGVTLYEYYRRGLLRFEFIVAPVHDSYGNEVATGYYRNLYEYDARGNVVHRIEAHGLAEQRDTWFAYDKANRLTSKWGEAVAVGLSPTTVTPTEYYRYDTRGNLVETIDANGARTLIYYDDLDRRVATLVQTGSAGNPQGVLSTFAYDPGGNLIRSRTYATLVALPGTAGGAQPAPADGNYRETVNSYDNLDRLKTSSVTGQSYGYWNGSSYVYATGATLTTSYDYDVVGNVVCTTGPDGAAVYSYYDVLDRKIAQVDGASYATSWSYDAEGNVLSERRHAGQASGVSTSGYSASTSTADRVTEFSYDRMGRRLTEARNGVEAWSLNLANGQLSGASGTSLIRYTYNALGQVKSKTEATGDVILYSYDNAGRLSLEMRQTFATPGGDVNPTVRYQYNGLGQLTVTRQGDASLQAGDRITTNSYDGAGRLTGVTDALGQTRSYVYDAAGRKLGETYSRALGDAAGTLVSEGIYYQYDLAGNVVRQAVNTVSGGSWSEVSYTRMAYNAFGEITDRGTNGGWQEQFAYDNGGRLIRSNAGDGVWRIHGYDQAGRQTLSLESDGATDLSALSQADAIGRIAGGTVTASATVYDGRGQATQAVQILRRTAAGGTAQNIATGRGYTAFGELAWETDAYGRRTDYSYNAMGRVTQIQRPVVSATMENGEIRSNVRPTERMFYDIAGRLIGTQDANSVETGSNVKTTRQLLAGTGYGDGEALVVKEWHPDGGAALRGYDVFGDQVSATDEIGRTTSMVYDKLGRLIQVTRPATALGALVQSYAYDVLGQRIGQWNNVVGYAGRERTQYDALGRITLQVAFGGDTTSTSYSWNGGMATSGMGSFGGWVATTLYANGLQSVSSSDQFGRLTTKTDLGGHVTTAGYDRVGRMTSRTISGAHGTEASSYTWLSNGQLGTISTSAGGITTTQNSTYDLIGNKLTEQGTRAGVVIQNATATYDALNRLVTWSETGNGTAPPASVSWRYDANGNIRVQSNAYNYLGGDGAVSAADGPQSTTYWYRYDSMNRVVTDRGMLSGGQIVRGAGGVDLSYDAAGQRRSARSDKALSGYVNVWVWHPDFDPALGHAPSVEQPGYNGDYQLQERGYYGQSVETYSYDGLGNLGSVQITASGYRDDGAGSLIETGMIDREMGGGVYHYDLLGRQTRQIDTVEGGAVLYDHSQAWDAKGRVWQDNVYQKQGNDLVTTNTTNYYSDDAGSGYALGALTSSVSTGHRYVNGYSYQAAPTATTTIGYAWFDGAVQAQVTYAVAGSAAQNTYYTNGPGGTFQSASVQDGRPRTITGTYDALGQVLRRDEEDNNGSLGDPHEAWYRFNGRQMGYTGNDGTWDNSYAGSLSDRTHTVWDGPGAFRYGGTLGTGHADFNERLTPINSYGQGSSSGSYTARGGETLSSVASALWGDAGLWYKLAAANGLGADTPLPAGQVLSVPAGVMRNTNNASTFKAYDPLQAYGDTSPTTPQPQAARKNKCGTFGAILMVVVAVAVTALTRVPFAKLFAGLEMGSAVGSGVAITGTTIGAASAAGIAGGVAAGVAGSVASQGFGVAAGIQDKFSWKGVALAGISAGVGSGLTGSLQTIAGSAFLGDAARGVLGSVIGQGIGVATGLQSKFDFAGLAAAGLGMGASGATGLGGFAGRLASNTAGGLANAAARSLIDGTSFGDNILAALPDVIGQTVGGMIADGVVGRDTRKMSRGEKALLAEAEKSANGISAVESHRIYQMRLANEVKTTVEVEQAAANIEFGDIVVTGQRYDAVYRPGIDRPLFFQIGGGSSSRNARVRIGGNGGPPLEDWRTLRQIGVPRVDGPAGAIFGVLDNLFDITGPALEMQGEFLDRWTRNNIADIRAIDPGHSFPVRLTTSGPEGESIRWKVANYEFYESELAATKYIYQGDIGALQNETLRVYQGFVDQGFAQALIEAKEGTLFQPQGWSRAQALGTRMDDLARQGMKGWFSEHRINPGADINVTVNTRLAAQPEGNYTIPDIRVGGVVFDASIARKDINTYQVQQFYTSPKVQSVFIVRPTSMGGPYFLPKSGNR